MGSVQAGSRRRAVIVGVGVVSAAGLSPKEVYDTISKGTSVARRLGWELDGCPVDIGAPVDDFDPGEVLSRSETRRMDRAAQFAVFAGAAAIEQAGGLRHEPHRRAVVVGSGACGLGTWAAGMDGWLDRGFRGLSPFIVPMIMPNAGAAHLSMMFDMEGPALTTGGACAAGTHALIDGVRLIRDGLADVVVAGGTEALLMPIILAAFARTGALSQRNDDPGGASRPFDRDRDGFVLGEGAAMFVLEEREAAMERGVTILGEIAGFGMSSDAFHIAAPRDDARATTAAMRQAIADAGIAPSDVVHVNAHGTSTVANDTLEAKALNLVFDGAPPPVTSAKGSIGHLIGGAGPVEMVASLLAMNDGLVPPVANFEAASDDISLDIVSSSTRNVGLGPFLKNSFAFGGHNASIVVSPHV